MSSPVISLDDRRIGQRIYLNQLVAFEVPDGLACARAHGHKHFVTAIGLDHRHGTEHRDERALEVAVAIIVKTLGKRVVGDPACT
ncbi:MAG: hypothetical protein QMC73_06085 [Myxococcota bacterium]